MNEAREGELKALAVRKYLDALCVYFWAATSLLFSLFTFGLFVLLGHKLTAEIVFTSLALFNVLIAPLNSFPWVLNGIVEAVVSVRRLQNFLVAWETSSDWAYASPAQHAEAASSEPTTPIRPNQLNVLAEGLTLDALNRADSSHLYTTINMERLPSALLPSLTAAPSLNPHQQASHTFTSPPHPASPLSRAPPPPLSATATAPTLAKAGRVTSSSFKDWGMARSNTGLPSQASNTSLASTAASFNADRQDSLNFSTQRAASSLQPQAGLDEQQNSSSVESLNSHNRQQSTSLSSASGGTKHKESPGVGSADQGIVTVLSDSSRLATANSFDGYSVVLSGASFSWHPTLGSDRVLTGKASRNQQQQRQSRQGLLQPQTGSQNDVSLHEISLTVRSGSLLLVMGEVGSGI